MNISVISTLIHIHIPWTLGTGMRQDLSSFPSMHKTYTFCVLQNQLGKTKLPWSEQEAQQNAQTINKMKLAVKAVRWMHQTVELSYHCHVYSVLFPHLTGILLPVNFVSVALFEFSLMLCGITCVLLFKSFHPVDFNQNEFCCSISVINETQVTIIKEQATIH